MDTRVKPAHDDFLLMVQWASLSKAVTLHPRRRDLTNPAAARVRFSHGCETLLQFLVVFYLHSNYPLCHCNCFAPVRALR